MEKWHGHYISDEDEALCQLNSEYRTIQQSREYKLGKNLILFIDVITRLDIRYIADYFRRKRITSKQSKLNAPNRELESNYSTIDTEKKVVVYTCVTGNYEKPVEPLYLAPNVDYFIITDMEISPDSKWKKIDINSIDAVRELNNVEKSRYPKILPHKIFKNYEYSIYIDGNVRVVSDVRKFIQELGRVPLASHWHPERNCLYMEAEACKIAKKADPVTIDNQVEKYQSQGMPREFGLIECNVLVRAHNDANCIKIMESWWTEFLNESKRDQLSFPFVLWKNGFTMNDIGILGNDVKENTSLQLLCHKH